MATMTMIFLAALLLTALLDVIAPHEQGALWHSARSLSGKANSVTLGLFLASLFDHFMLPWLDIVEVISAKGKWTPGTHWNEARPYVILGWFMLYCSIVLATGWGGAH